MGEGMRSIDSGLRSILPGRDLYFVGMDILAVALQKQGDLRGGLGKLEMTSRQQAQAVFQESGLFWVRCQYRLANLYREIGREQDAGAIAAQLSSLYSEADDDHPMQELLSELSAGLDV